MADAARIRFDPLALHKALDEERQEWGMTWRDIAGQTGISASTFTKVAAGACPSVTALGRMLTWLGETDLAPYLIEETP